MVINVVLSGTSIEFEPSPLGFEIVILNVFDKMVEAVSCIPRVETKLYPTESNVACKAKLKPVIADEIIETAKEQVHVFSKGSSY